MEEENKDKSKFKDIMDKLIDKLDWKKQHQHPLFRELAESEKLIFNKIAPSKFEYTTYEQQQQQRVS